MGVGEKLARFGKQAPALLGVSAIRDCEIELSCEGGQFAQAVCVLGGVAGGPVEVSREVCGALRQRGEHVEEVCHPGGRGGVLTCGVGQLGHLAANLKELLAEDGAHATIGDAIEVVREALHVGMKLGARLAAVVRYQARDEQCRREQAAARGEDGGLGGKGLDEVFRPQLQESKEHRVGKVPAWVELRGAHVDERERHCQVDEHAQHGVGHRKARRHQGKRAHKEEAGILAGRVVLTKAHLKKGGVRRDHQEVGLAKRKVDHPEEANEEEDGRQRGDKPRQLVTQPRLCLVAVHGPASLPPPPMIAEVGAAGCGGAAGGPGAGGPVGYAHS